jgi:hypothetical protein
MNLRINIHQSSLKQENVKIMAKHSQWIEFLNKIYILHLPGGGYPYPGGGG